MAEHPQPPQTTSAPCAPCGQPQQIPRASKQPDQPPGGVYAERAMVVINCATKSFSAQTRQAYVKCIIASQPSTAAGLVDRVPSGEFAKRLLNLVHTMAERADKLDRAKAIDDWAAWLGLECQTTCKQVNDNGFVVTTFSTSCSQTPELVETSYIN